MSSRCSDAQRKGGSALLHTPHLTFITQQVFKWDSSLWCHLSSVLLIPVAKKLPTTFSRGGSVSNTHKNNIGGLGKNKCHLWLRREPLPGHPIYAMAAHKLIFQHRPIHVTEKCPTKAQVALQGAAPHRWQEMTHELHLSPCRSRPHMVGLTHGTWTREATDIQLLR